jgi:hypothetical protein
MATSRWSAATSCVWTSGMDFLHLHCNSLVPELTSDSYVVPQEREGPFVKLLMFLPEASRRLSFWKGPKKPFQFEGAKKGRRRMQCQPCFGSKVFLWNLSFLSVSSEYNTPSSFLSIFKVELHSKKLLEREYISSIFCFGRTWSIKNQWSVEKDAKGVQKDPFPAATNFFPPTIDFLSPVYSSLYDFMSSWTSCLNPRETLCSTVPQVSWMCLLWCPLFTCLFSQSNTRNMEDEALRLWDFGRVMLWIPEEETRSPLFLLCFSWGVMDLQ